MQVTQPDRFIPAGAGNTKRKITDFKCKPVYPRWRGEHGVVVGNVQQWTGLSPLARGTPDAQFSPHFRARFIPAGAGNTASRHDTHCGQPVYPRWRGEHQPISFSLTEIIGLSPLARGTRVCSRYARLQRRFIPAGAGNTSQAQPGCQRTAVYPRWRGEQAGVSKFWKIACWFIPAGAGNTKMNFR